AMLSGGVDSSTVASLMTQISGQPINTFTVGFDGDFEDNELDFARQHAQRINSHHHEVVISADEFSSFLPHAIHHLEEPVATASTLAMYKVCELARKHVKVVLTGQGADEPFAGYHRYLGERYGEWYRRVPSPIRNYLISPIVMALPRNERLKRAVNSLGESDNTQRIINIYNTFDPSLQKSLYQSDIMHTNGFYKSVYELQKEVNHLDSVTQMLYMDARLYQADNLAIYGDKMSMANSLEARVPFLDLDLMKFVERIPPSLKIKGRVRKYILKKAVSKWIPDEVINRRKIGFATPVDQWFRGEWRNEIYDRLLASNSGCQAYLNSSTIESILDEHYSGREDHKRLLFSLMTFEIWHEQFIKTPIATQ
ncbi:MAG: asparagine synthase C-terminal domain-containing protein, partial [Chloroflexota bacterium]